MSPFTEPAVPTGMKIGVLMVAVRRDQASRSSTIGPRLNKELKDFQSVLVMIAIEYRERDNQRPGPRPQYKKPSWTRIRLAARPETSRAPRHHDPN